jgi:hypothetical protein
LGNQQPILCRNESVSAITTFWGSIMANVNYWFGYWVSATDTDALAPGDAHSWVAWPYSYGEAVGISASATEPGEEHILAVENLSLQDDLNGRRMLFTVRNVGRSRVNGYGIGYSHISQ